jgi:hypothetical protein
MSVPLSGIVPASLLVDELLDGPLGLAKAGESERLINVAE